MDDFQNHSITVLVVLGIIALAKYLNIGPILIGLFVALTQ